MIIFETSHSQPFPKDKIGRRGTGKGHGACQPGDLQSYEISEIRSTKTDEPAAPALMYASNVCAGSLRAGAGCLGTTRLLYDFAMIETIFEPSTLEAARMSGERTLSISLPYAHEYDYEKRRGRRVWRGVYRSAADVSVRVIDARFTRIFRTLSDGVETFGFEGRLYRLVKDSWGHAFSPAELQAMLASLRPIRMRRRTHGYWMLRDFPRPPYARLPRFEGRSAIDYDPCPFLFGDGRGPRRLDLSKAVERREQAREWYARAFLVSDDKVWVEVPPPCWVIDPVERDCWQLRCEMQPSPWQAALAFPLTINGSVCEGRAVAKRFAEELAIELVPTRPEIEQFDVFRDVSSIASLASWTLAIADMASTEDGLEQLDVSAERELVKKALAAIPRPDFPWCPGHDLYGLDPRCNRLRLHRRWQFEFRQPANWDLLRELWGSNQTILYRAIANDRNESPTRKTSLEDWEALDALSIT